MSDEAVLLFVLVGIVAVLWWALHGLAQWRCAYVLNELADVVARGGQLTESQVVTLVDAVGDAMPLRDQEAARLLRRVRTASITRVCLMLVVAEQDIATRRGARLLRRAREILEQSSPSMFAELVAEAEVGAVRDGRRP